MKQLILVLVLLILVGCAPSNPTIVEVPTSDSSSAVETKEFDLRWSYVERFVDDEAGVVCWVVLGKGIDCLPLSETTLER